MSPHDLNVQSLIKPERRFPKCSRSCKEHVLYRHPYFWPCMVFKIIYTCTSHGRSLEIQKKRGGGFKRLNVFSCKIKFELPGSCSFLLKTFVRRCIGVLFVFGITRSCHAKLKTTLPAIIQQYT